VCDFLLVINTYWHPISYRFEVIADYCSNFGHCVFEPPFGGLGATYILGSLKSTYSGLPISVNWTFFTKCYCWGATSKNRLKIGVMPGGRSVSIKFSRGKGVSSQSFSHGYLGQLTTLSLIVLTQRNFVADVFQAKCGFRWTITVLRFWVPF